MSTYRAQVAAAAAAVTIHGPTQYAWLGRKSRRLPESLDDALEPAERRLYLISCLREELYCSFYCHGGPVAARWGEPQPASSDPWLLDAMTRADTGRGGWDPGWTVQRVDGDIAVVANSHMRMRVAAADCDGDARPGAAVRIRRPTRLLAVAPGYWTILGDAPDPLPRVADVRVYWNVTRSGAPALVAALTSRLNDERVPFRLKVADHPVRLERCDAAVLYLDGVDFRRIRNVLGELAAALGIWLRPEIPAFTLELAPGVGLAEGDHGMSFGFGRCTLLAEGLLRAHELGLAATDERVATVAARFADDGVAIDAPYLDPSLAGEHVL